MLEVSAFVTIGATPKTVWEFIIDIERWWIFSNIDHVEMKIYPPDKPIQIGTKIDFVDLIAGIPGTSRGKIRSFNWGKDVAWAGSAVYRYWGLKIKVKQGVLWSIEPAKGGTRLTVDIWAEFRENAFGQFSEWYFSKILKGVERDREHTMKELTFIKERLENDKFEF